MGNACSTDSKSTQDELHAAADTNQSPQDELQATNDTFQARPLAVAKHTPHELEQVGSSVQIPLSLGADCQLALQWDFDPGQGSVDLDACAVALNALGVVVGAAFFNNLVALEGAMCHRGDSRDGAAQGDDEVIDLDLDRLPSQGVCSVALCVFAYKDGSLSNVRGITAVLRVKDKDGQWLDAVNVPVADIVGERNAVVTGILVAGIYSPDKGKTWSVRRLGHPLEGPRDFQAGGDDVRDACFAANIIRKPPPGGRVLTENAMYQMRKRDEAGVRHQEVRVGLGWVIARGKPKIDLDASCIMLGPPRESGYRAVMDVVWHNDTQAPGVAHSGDNRTGDGDGDDEVIDIDFSKLDHKIERLVITINSYNGSFKDVERAWARVVDPKTGKEMARYQLEHIETQAVLFCAFDRREGGQWVFETIGKGCEGRTAKSGECVDCVRGRPYRRIKELRAGESMFLPCSMYDDSADVFSVLDEWGCRGEWMWLDATLLLFSRDGKMLGEVDFNDRKWPVAEPIITHSGDRQDEAGRHGSHEIRIFMQRLTSERPDVFSVLLVISAYTRNLSGAIKPFVSLRDSDDAEVARYEPDCNFDATSIQMIDLHRHPVGWMLSAHGFLGDGKANQYGPVVEAYGHILKQLTAAGDAKRPTIDYEAVRKAIRQRKYKHGPQ